MSKQSILNNSTPNQNQSMWLSIILASIILMITMGVRQTVGLFVHPLLNATTMNIAEISMAFAIGQLMWGVFQPIFGAIADRKGAFTVLLAGAFLIAAGQLITLWADNIWLLTLAQGILSPAGAAAGSFSVLIGIVASRLSSDKASVASGVINAGGSLGQFLLAPIVQFANQLKGYSLGLILLAASALASIIPAWFLSRGEISAKTPKVKDHSDFWPEIRSALKNKSYILLHIGFFTCGFHVAFLTTHLPSQVSLSGFHPNAAAISLSLIGLCNIAGSVLVGYLGKYYKMKYILSSLYAFRALVIFIYLISPKTETDLYVFAVMIGFTWLATVPPTAGIVGKLFGTKYLATLFGLTLLSHQVGGFLGAWLGGVALHYAVNLDWVWRLDITLAIIASLVNLPINEPSPQPLRTEKS